MKKSFTLALVAAIVFGASAVAAQPIVEGHYKFGYISSEPDGNGNQIMNQYYDEDIVIEKVGEDEYSMRFLMFGEYSVPVPLYFEAGKLAIKGGEIVAKDYPLPDGSVVDIWIGIGAWSQIKGFDDRYVKQEIPFFTVQKGRLDFAYFYTQWFEESCIVFGYDVDGGERIQKQIAWPQIYIPNGKFEATAKTSIDGGGTAGKPTGSDVYGHINVYTDEYGNPTGKKDIIVAGADGWLNELKMSYDEAAGTVTVYPMWVISIVDNHLMLFTATDNPRDEVNGTVEVSADGYYTIKFPDGLSLWSYDTDFVSPFVNYTDVVIRFNPDRLGAINSVAVDVTGSEAPVEYFNLQGMRVSNPVAGTVVIRRQGAEVSKVLVK